MFDFISKLIHGRSVSKKNDQQAIVILNKALQDEDKHKSIEQERQSYLQKIDAAANNESALIDLLTQCDFADGRFHAAQKITSQSGMEMVLPAMRRLDKRVAKLLQARLDEISQQEQNELAAQACIDAAERLLQQTIILSNQVVDLDKQYAQLKSLSPELIAQFQKKRQILAQGLDQQIQLQQRLLGLLQAFDAVDDHAALGLNEKFLIWQATIDACVADQYAASLPKNLLNECQLKLRALQDNWRGAQQPLNRMQDHVSSSDSIATDDLGQESVQVPAKSVIKKMSRPILSLSLEQIESNLHQMEAALEQGSVQIARQFDRELRDVDTKQNYANLVLNVALKERINLARKELQHLLSWAKWSGNASRDELVNTAEGLAGLKLSPKEIVGTVSALREQWKQTETNSGSASKELWTRFDAACNAAYAPAAQFFNALNEQRKLNVAQTEIHLNEWRVQAQALLISTDAVDAQPDWKRVSGSILQMQQSWRALGPVDRKDKQRLDRDFDAMLAPLRQALAQRQTEEVSAREALILAATQLDSAQSSSLDQLRQLQQRWQAQAASVPMPRKEEQALWERFRAACDAVFEKKRANAENADKQRQDNLQAKEKICLDLEQARHDDLGTSSKITEVISNAKTAWRLIGQVPRSEEQKIEQQFQTLLDALQQQLQQAQSKAQQEKSQGVLAKIDTCLQLELLLLSPDPETTTLHALKQTWSATPLPNSLISKSLQQRFEQVCDVLESLPSDVDTNLRRQQVIANRPAFDDSLLHLEILLGVDSPVELSRERLQKQVEVLQSSLKNGQNQKQLGEMLNQLLSLPLMPDLVVQQRIQNVLARANLMVQ
jgi:exonuclease SbcC